jgi:hypothetical protein
MVNEIFKHYRIKIFVFGNIQYHLYKFVAKEKVIFWWMLHSNRGCLPSGYSPLFQALTENSNHWVEKRLKALFMHVLVNIISPLDSKSRSDEVICMFH